MITIVCTYCKKEFQTNYKYKNKKKNRFCSNDCNVKHHNEKTRSSKICPICNKEFNGLKNQTYCSCKCGSISGNNKKYYHHEKEIDKPKTCLYCGKIFYHKNKTVKCCSYSCSARFSAKSKGLEVLKEQKRICLICSKEFIPTSKEQKCCSEICAIKSRALTQTKNIFTCQYCGKQYHAKNKYRNKYCSRECAFEHKKAKPKIKTPKPLIKQTCFICEKEFESKTLKKCCSKECEKKRQCVNAKTRSETIKKQTEKPRPCKQCGRIFIPEYGNKRRNFCSKECLKKYGKKHRRQKEKARKRQLPATLTVVQWKETLNYFGGRCAYCGQAAEEIHQEHFIPQSKGGGYTQNNIIPGCRSCNLDKSDFNFFDWYPTKPFYSELRERKILKYLGVDEKCRDSEKRAKRTKKRELVQAESQMRAENPNQQISMF